MASLIDSYYDSIDIFYKYFLIDLTITEQRYEKNDVKKPIRKIIADRLLSSITLKNMSETYGFFFGRNPIRSGKMVCTDF